MEGISTRLCVLEGESTYLVFAVHGIAAANARSAGSARPHWTIVAPARAPLPVGTITSHMAGVTADTADDASSVVLLLGTVVLAMSNLPAVLACLVLVVAESSVQRSKLAQLVTLQLVLALGN